VLATVAPADISIWRNRPFLLLWLAQAISQTVQNAIWFGMLVLVETYSGSTTQLGVAIMSLILPSVLFSLIAGVFVDRWPKRSVLWISNARRAVVMLGYIVAGGNLPLVYAVNFAFSAISQFFAPAETATIPLLVHRRRLLQANSLFHLTFTASQLFGIVLIGPIIVKLAGLNGLFLTIGVGFAVCAALCWPLPRERALGTPAPSEGRLTLSTLREDLREVRRFVFADRVVLMGMVHLTLGATLGLVVAELAPSFVTRVLGVAADDAVFVLAPAGVGMVVGAVLLSRFSERIDRHLVVHAGLFFLAVALFVMGLLQPVYRLLRLVTQGAAGSTMATGDLPAVIGVVMVTTFFAGIAFACLLVPSQTNLQERSGPEMRGRLFAAQLMLGNLASIIPLVLIGGLADLFGIAPVLLALGVVVFAIAALSLGRAPHLGKARR